MAILSKQDRQRVVAQTLGSWAIEGFKPDVEYLVLLDRYISGELTLPQLREITDARFGVKEKQNGEARTT